MCSVCTKCGDGICGKGENKCNCPEDCEKNGCKTLNPYGYGVCAMVLGYVYTGKECKLASGCSCKPDCDYFFKTKEDCEKACIPAKSCIVSGCSGEICATESMMSICIWKPEYACLKYSECGLFGENSTCAWKKTEAYLDCLKDINNKNY
jgi:eight-cysteine-cluster-containing protein